MPKDAHQERGASHVTAKRSQIHNMAHSIMILDTQLTLQLPNSHQTLDAEPLDTQLPDPHPSDTHSLETQPPPTTTSGTHNPTTHTPLGCRTSRTYPARKSRSEDTAGVSTRHDTHLLGLGPGALGARTRGGCAKISGPRPRVPWERGGPAPES
ncbi:hypothetical protein P7K49_033698 [Saguinus oedipus]|uniref:Uncharacterized protein n=1 Tax=Saguinus oedipus TaxID=9490 RepID=A0ABQ9TSN8_SAGOE|nr:hypothetical protein P7K49_033698 [Saguinus oedipus]